jgi:hypothetical protein
MISKAAASHAAVEERRSQIIDERPSMQNEHPESGNQQATARTEGIADLAEGCFDGLAMTAHQSALAEYRFVDVDIPVDPGNGR